MVKVNPSGHDECDVVNPNDAHWYTRLYCLWFGAVGTTKVYVWARSFEDALEEAAGYLADQGWRGYFTEPDYRDAARDEYAEREGVGWEAGDHPTSRYARVRAAYPDESDPFAPYRDDIDEEEWGEAVRGRAEADLTYTESGYIASWEWGGVECHDADEYEHVKAVCLTEDDE